MTFRSRSQKMCIRDSTEAARQIDALLERVSLTEVRRKKIIKLSGGMKRLSLIHI